MNDVPQFFAEIRQRASQRWDQLEADPELAGPWHQLFKQVQSPRHILSELLQNADDARATEASVRIEDRVFIFEHNGDDFTKEHFASLCRFGYSNKRSLHTIGFRGIGFKSTFSLGDTVELYTPTLSVSFDRKRFTEPRWMDQGYETKGKTWVRVTISDEHRQNEVEKNLQEWLASPLSLLFFRNIRCLRVGPQEVHWGSFGPGPVPDTEWIALHDGPDRAYLIARSKEEYFPTDALAEIAQERLLGDDQGSDFPPCKVEIVLGIKGRLYVVLPTGVETKLPFACNAPFIQDPARLKIKDVETSPTNRWLLKRIGSLAASIMLQWLEQNDTSLVDRSEAYGFFPDVDRNDNTLEGVCATTVEKTFDAAIEGKAFLLTDFGDLTPAGQSVIIPEVLFDVWPAEEASLLLDEAGRPPLSRHLSGINKEKLVNWKLTEEINRGHVLRTLQRKHLPKPKSWHALLRLWAYVSPVIVQYSFDDADRKKVRIIPVQGKDVLYSANEVVRLGEKKLLQSDMDWDFLAAHLLVLNQNWPRFLAERYRDAEERQDNSLRTDINAANAILKAIDLEQTSDVTATIERVAMKFFAKEPVSLGDCIRFAQIAAKLNANTGKLFRFVTQNGTPHSTDQVLLFDNDGTLETLFRKSWREEHLLHSDYSKSYDSCNRDEWMRWIYSGRARLYSFVLPIRKFSHYWSRKQLEVDLRKRGLTDTVHYAYTYDSFRIEDWDFDNSIWDHWVDLATKDTNVWSQVGELILTQSVRSKAQSAEAYQRASNGYERRIASGLLPTWVLRLRDVPCLPDTRGFYRKPTDLLRRTPETESVIDVEAFIHSRLDTEATRPLLKLLGVSETPTSPDRLLNRLRALAMADKPPVHEVDKWYIRLDQMIETCSTTALAEIKKVFSEEEIILTENSGWSRVSGVFLSLNEDDVPGAAVIRDSVRDLSIWAKVGVAERPTPDMAIQWLKELDSGTVLSQDDARRVKALLPRHSERVWSECSHWLNLAGEWVPTGTLDFALTMQTLVPWSHLHEWVKQKTADFQRLPVEIAGAGPFNSLVSLASQIEDRFKISPYFLKNPERKPWLNQFGIDLRRIELDGTAGTVRIKELAAELAETDWQTSSELEIVPYVNGIPAGTARRAEVVWLNRVLYVDILPNAKLARLVPDTLGKIFGRSDVTAALNYCFNRTREDVTEYLTENFKLAPREATESSTGESVSEAEAYIPTDTGEPVPPPSGETGVEHERMKDIGEADAVSQSESEDEHSLEDSGENIGETDRKNRTHSKETPGSKPAKPSIIERFAQSRGFIKEGDDRFYHADGSWIAKTHGDHRFPWARRTSTGELVCYYWSRDHCLEQGPLQVEADIWGMVDNHPKTHAFILSDRQGNPKEITGDRLRSMCTDGKIALYPATYRLVYRNDDEE
ncbi:MAG: ATP-binding protein [Syntrophorhabdaceae bacterium]|nr:ATP-binding protein [Syntrophorhabdaceae bacterium]